MAMSEAFMSVAAIIGIFLLSALPLYFSVKVLGGKTSLLKTVFIAFITGIIASAIEQTFRLFGSILAFAILIWIYHEVFRLKWLKAILAWFLQFVFIALIYLIYAIFIAALIGFSVIGNV